MATPGVYATGHVAISTQLDAGSCRYESTTAMRALPFALALVLCAATASAQPADAYKKGVKLENSGDLVGALSSFESIPEAKRDFNARLHIASCKKKLGRLLEAERDYESIRTDPKADAATVDTAASDLEDLRPRIPKLVVKLSAATKEVAVAIDGHPSKVPVTVTVNPGTHSVIATRNDSVVFKREVTLAESTTIEVEVDAPAPASAPVVSEPPPVKRDPAPVSSAQKTWGWIGIGTSVAFGAAAVGAWVYSGSLADDYKNECLGGACDKSKESPIRTWETLSFVSAGVAVVAVGVGVTLLITAPKENPVTVSASTNGVWLRGSF